PPLPLVRAVDRIKAVHGGTPTARGRAFGETSGGGARPGPWGREKGTVPRARSVQPSSRTDPGRRLSWTEPLESFSEKVEGQGDAVEWCIRAGAAGRCGRRAESAWVTFL